MAIPVPGTAVPWSLQKKKKKKEKQKKESKKANRKPKRLLYIYGMSGCSTNRTSSHSMYRFTGLLQQPFRVSRLDVPGRRIPTGYRYTFFFSSLVVGLHLASLVFGTSLPCPIYLDMSTSMCNAALVGPGARCICQNVSHAPCSSATRIHGHTYTHAWPHIHGQTCRSLSAAITLLGARHRI